MKRPAACMSEPSCELEGGEPSGAGLSMPMPSLEGETKQFSINGCVVYHNPNLRSWRIRVAAFRGSRFTKCFGWGQDPHAQWADVIDYCRRKPPPPY